MGGRIKVADFGLVKDLQDVNCSIISGLTPVYAAPELFDGRPNNHSDQYSLAIVYQEMLTGALPYEGRTTAQLAAQHLHSRPRLGPPAGFRPGHDCPGPLEGPRRSGSRAAATWSRACWQATPEPVRGRAARPCDARRPRRRPCRAGEDRGALAGSIRAAAAAARAPISSMTQPTEPAPTVTDLPPLELQPEDIAVPPDDLRRHRRAGGQDAADAAPAAGGPLRTTSARCPPCSCSCSRPTRRP